MAGLESMGTLTHNGGYMAIVRRKNSKLQVCIQGEVILEADSIDEIRHWLDVLGMTATIRFV